MRAVLVNPAVRPYELLKDALGPQTNLYTGARYEFTAAHLAELRALEVAAHHARALPAHRARPATKCSITATRSSAIAAPRQIVIEGGDHGFGDFDALPRPRARVLRHSR